MIDALTADLEQTAATMIDPWKVLLLRHAAKLSQEELGRAVGYRTGAGIMVSGWETYQREIPRARLGKLAEVLGSASGSRIDPMSLCSSFEVYMANQQRCLDWRESRRPLAMFLTESGKRKKK